MASESTNAYQGRTTVTELRDRIRKLGGTPKGKTKAALMDELEQLSVGDGSTITQADINEAVVRALETKLPEAIASMGTGPLTDEEMDYVFGDGE